MGSRRERAEELFQMLLFKKKPGNIEKYIPLSLSSQSHFAFTRRSSSVLLSSFTPATV
jgi:hypothetical protein